MIINYRYSLYQQVDLIGLLTLIFVRDELKFNISVPEHEVVKTGFKSTYGNKGFILTRFKFNDTYIAICSAHLHGKKLENEKRLEELKLILNSKITGKSNTKFVENDVFFIIGDLNFKVNNNVEVLNEIIKSKNYSLIDQIDEFAIERRKNLEISKEITEGKIFFNPTYQFNIKSKDYNNIKTPSW